jgi:IMP dehydrogenase
MKFKLREIDNLGSKHYKGFVHDLTVQDNHSYNVKGIVVHNSICSTRIQTGHGMSTLASIKDIVDRSELYKTHNRIPLIADGGIRNSGDIVKALAFGADFVMLGSLLAGHKQCPGEVMVNQDGERFKVYRGMASKEAQINWRGYTSSLEGVSSTVRYKGDVMDTLRELEINIRSGLSYSGVRTINDLQQKFFYVQQTSAGAAESTTHILGVK